MAIKPILFSVPMVRALLEGRKTQTRRVLKPQPEHLQVYDWKGERLHESEYRHWCWKGHVGADNWASITDQLGPFLPYVAGDLLWVRESHAFDGPLVRYQATDDIHPLRRVRSPIHMPRWASRLTLKVTDVRVQRVQNISTDDCYDEGVRCDMSARTVIDHFRILWDSLNAKRGFGWDDNPFVAAYTFEVIKANVDQIQSEPA